MIPLRCRMAEDMQVRNLSTCTQDTYIQQVSLFARDFGKSPELLGPEQIREYQVHPAAEKRLAPGSIGVAVAALCFLYGATLQKDWNTPEVLPTPKQPAKPPVVPSPEEVVSFLDAVPILHTRVVLTTCYAAGLRISDAVSPRPTDIDSRRMVVRVEQGKGGKDRCVMLSPRLKCLQFRGLFSVRRRDRPSPREARRIRSERHGSGLPSSPTFSGTRGKDANRPVRPKRSQRRISAPWSWWRFAAMGRNVR